MRRRARGCPARGLLCVLLLGAACAGEDAPPPHAAAVRVRDDMGREVLLLRPAARVISLIPAQTDVVRRLAGAQVLVARTAWDEHPDLAHLPSTGNALSPSVEWLAALRPDLVIAWPDQQSRSTIAQLQSMGIAVYASAVQTLDDVDSMIVRLGALLGREAAADSLGAALAGELAAVRAAAARRPPVKVYYAMSVDPPMAATNQTYLGELIETAGGSNIFPRMPTLWPQVSLEEVLRRDPDVILRPLEEPRGRTLAQLRALPGWRDLRAVRSGRVHEVDADLLNRPGAELGEAARILFGLIHAETKAAMP